MRPGDLISSFMKSITRADLVVVVLRDKYLRSPYCALVDGMGRRFATRPEDCHLLPALRKAPVERLLFDLVQDGGPLLYHNDSEERQRSFESPAGSFGGS